MKRALAFALVLCISVSVIVVVLVTRSTTSSFVTVYIRSDGAVSPSSEPIKRVGNVYNLTGNINGSIVVQRNNSVIDGNGYALQGLGYPYGYAGVGLYRVKNVTIENMQIQGNDVGIWLNSSSNNLVFGNNITGNGNSGISIDFSSSNNVTKNAIAETSQAIGIRDYSNDNSLSGNRITSYVGGIWLDDHCNRNRIVGNLIDGKNETHNALGTGVGLERDCNYTSISGNVIENNEVGVLIWTGFNGEITGNNITDNRAGISFDVNNTFYHNNLIGNTNQTQFTWSVANNSWDDGYPSGGNYWSDYDGTDSRSGSYQNVTGNDGIGDTPYIINGNNQDRYPLMTPFKVAPISKLTLQRTQTQQTPFWMTLWFLSMSGVITVGIILLMVQLKHRETKRKNESK